MYELSLASGFVLSTPDLARGSAVHSVLAQLHRLPPEERSSSRAEELAIEVAEKWLVNQFCLHGRLMDHPEYSEKKRGVWLPEGIENPERAGEKWMISVLEAVDGYFRLEDPKKVDTLHCEYGVRHPLSRIKSDLGFLEGRIDRLDREVRSENGKEKTVLVIVDYKASAWGAYVDSGFRQLAAYAACLSKEPPFSYDSIEGRLLYLNPNDGVPNTCKKAFKEADLDEALRKAAEVREEIIKVAASPGGFPPKPGWHCKTCQFKEKCPAHQTDQPLDRTGVPESLRSESAAPKQDLKQEGMPEERPGKEEFSESAGTEGQDDGEKDCEPDGLEERLLAGDRVHVMKTLEGTEGQDDGEKNCEPDGLAERILAGDRVRVMKTLEDARQAAQVLLRNLS